jgi:serine/threonine protein phosphatase PrpC
MTAEPLPLPTDALPDAIGSYRLRDRLEVRGDVSRWAGMDETGSPVVIISEPSQSSTAVWPSLAWEENLRDRAADLGLAGIRERFEDADGAHLVLEFPAGVTLWNVWDDPAFGAPERYGWLSGLADLVRRLHAAGAVLESLRPEQVRVSPLGQVLLDPTVVLLPLPAPREAPIRPSLVSPPELIEGHTPDPRSDLYCIGAVLYALELGHELSELDFRGPGDPIPFLDRFPEAHPFLGRLIGKTLSRSREQRFPAPNAADLTGFDELIATLGEAQRVLGRARLDVAAWTSPGMVRPANEDALAVIHATDLRVGANEEFAIVLAADGMGGSAAGEVAAALTIQTLRRHLLIESPLRRLVEEPESFGPGIEREAIRRLLADALEEANGRVYNASRATSGQRGMGCTAEAVYLDGRQVVVGHVGDSRTYLLHRGRLVQMTRDHTMVGRMVELGRLTVDQAAAHPRRNELRQAIGCRPDVRPDLSSSALSAGDWVVVCTDGLTGCVRSAEIQQILEQSTSAEAAARRLINRANQLGATDNVSVVVVRAT